MAGHNTFFDSKLDYVSAADTHSQKREKGWFYWKYRDATMVIRADMRTKNFRHQYTDVESPSWLVSILKLNERSLVQYLRSMYWISELNERSWAQPTMQWRGGGLTGASGGGTGAILHLICIVKIHLFFAGKVEPIYWHLHFWDQDPPLQKHFGKIIFQKITQGFF